MITRTECPWSLDAPLPTGGATDEYGRFRRETEYGALMAIVEAALASFASDGNRGVFEDQSEQYEWKIPDDSVAGIAHWKRGSYEYTVSVFLKVHEGFVSGLRFWAVFWIDEDVRRTLYRPIELLAPGVAVVLESELEGFGATSEGFLRRRFDDLREILVMKSTVPLDRLTEALSYSL